MASGRLPPAALTSTLTGPNCLDDCVASPAERIAIQGVGGLKDGLAAGRLDVAHALGSAFGIAADNGHARSGGGQRIGHGPAQHAGAADHHGDFLLEIERIAFHFSTNSGFKCRS